MTRRYLTICAMFLLCLPAWAQAQSRGASPPSYVPPFFTEEDLTPTPALCSQVKFPTGTLTNDNGVCTVNTGGGGSGDSITVNGAAVSITADYVDTATIAWIRSGAGAPHTVTASVVAGSIGATELNEASVEAGLEALLDLQDLQGAVTDAQVPNTITIDLAATATALAANGSNCAAGQYPLGVNASGAVESCTPDDDVPEVGDFGAALALEPDGSLSTNSVGAVALDEAGVKTALEAVLEVANLQGTFPGDRLTFPDGTFSVPASATMGGTLTLGEDSDIGINTWTLTVGATNLSGNTTCTIDSSGRIPDSCVGNGTDDGGVDLTALHSDVAGEIAGIADKATPVAADHLLIEDSAASNAKKDITIGSLETALEGVLDLQDLQGAVTDGQVPDTITASNYLPLTGGALIGQLLLDNLGIEFEETNTPPTCGASNFNIYASLADGTLKKCVAGTTSDLDTGGDPVASGLDAEFDAGRRIDGAVSLGTAVQMGGTTRAWHFYQDGAGALRGRACDTAGANCVTSGVQAEAGSDWAFVNEEGDTCASIDSVSGILTQNETGNCTAQISTGIVAATGNVTVGGTLGVTGTSTLGTTNTGALGVTGNATVSGNLTTTGTSKGMTPIKTVSTNPYTMLTSDCDTMLLIATGAGEVDLIADPTTGVSNAGCMVCFYQVNAVTLLLDPNGTDTIDAAAATLTLAAGDRLQLANLAGNQVCLLGTSASTWITLPGVGTLTDAN